MPKLYDYRVFISHAWKYGNDYDRLINLLNNANNFSYYNYSAPKEKPLFPDGTPFNNSDIAKKITDKISPSQITIVISGMYVQYKDWIKYEIDESIRMKKPILGIKPYGNSNIPTYVFDNANKIVNWNTDSIVSAIRELVK
ncbi:nuclease [Clostridioides difficile]|uniref:TIR domain-containing protein n=1 Tax=Clostridioides difficile TaxID=1496 RepID=UPI00093E7132|nr:TIR domain-containing protein [Clostridioides difficile]EGT4826343.1 nuclease [Clostridioides difficile]EGT5247077.1 nuclease [Clostridioides difficile]MBF9869648.1 TIR domain-containing protein [Clostridioides difficile]MBF9872889.1 TIR domain-containing protein [Clostridioides difficile]MBG0099043.1 TIR domain-containing protein [Clostridioides difficile]